MSCILEMNPFRGGGDRSGESYYKNCGIPLSEGFFMDTIVFVSYVLDFVARNVR
jgi:hypothetical protein